MANSKSQQYEIIKNGPLCLDKYCADVVPFGQGFNKKNSPLLGGAISNVFSKEDASKKNYYSDGKNEIYYKNGHVIVNGTDYGTFNNQKFVINDIVLDGVKLNKDNCLDYVNSNNYILKNNEDLTIKVNSYKFTRSYNPNAFYKIVNIGSTYFYLEYRRIYNDNATFNVDLKIAINASRFIYDDVCIEDVPTTVENNIRVEFCSYNGKVYFYIVCLDKEFEFSDDFHFKEYIYNTGQGGTIDIHVDAKWVKASSYQYRCLLEFDTNNNYSVKSILLSYSTSSASNNSSISILYPVLCYDRIGYNIIKYQITISGEIDGSHIKINNSLSGWLYPTNSSFSGNLFLYKDVKRIASTTTTNEYTFDDTIPSSFEPFTSTYNIDFPNSSYLPATKEFFYENIYCCYSRYNYDNVNNLCHVMIDHNYSGSYIFTASDHRTASLSEYLVEQEGQPNKGYLIGSDFGSGTSYTLPHYNIPTRTNIHNTKYNNYRFGVLLDENQLPTGISYANADDSPNSFNSYNLGTIITPWNSIDTTMPVNLYYDIAYVDKKGSWKKIDIVEGVDISLLGDFVLLNTTSKYNAIIISRNEKTIWANDWNNRIIGTNPFLLIQHKSVFASNKKVSFTENSAINSNWDIQNSIPSSFMSRLNLCLYSSTDVDANILFSLFNSKIGPVCAISNDLAIDVYLEIPSASVAGYFVSLQQKYNSSESRISTESYTDSALSGTQWKPGNIIYYNPTIVGTLLDTLQDMACLLYGDELYLLHYITDGRYILLYRLNSNIENLSAFFAVQGQAYIISNNKIYNYAIENEAVKLSTFICDITGLRFLTFTPNMAYFWSEIDSSIYVFSADNIIRKLYIATDITFINNAIYYPSCNMTAFSTNLGILCYHEDLGMFVIENSTTSGKLFLQPDGYITYSDNNRVIYYTLWFPAEDSETWTKNDIILSTKFYGIGSNVISITDTWYFRLFADKDLYEQMDIDRSGKLKLSIDALTDQGMSTEVKEIDIKESDWDELTDTLYIRYQPKLQRGVGISLNVDSPFAIGYLGLGNIAETTQMSRPSMQV